MSGMLSNNTPLPKATQSALNLFCDAAADGDRAAVIEFLDTYGVDQINQRSSDDLTALEHALWRDQAEIMKLLLERGADPDVRDNDGKTALIQAAMRYNSTPILTMLLEHGADLHAVDKWNKTAVDHAQTAGDIDAVVLLQQWPELQKMKQKLRQKLSEEVRQAKETWQRQKGAKYRTRMEKLKQSRPKASPFVKHSRNS